MDMDATCAHVIPHATLCSDSLRIAEQTRDKCLAGTHIIGITKVGDGTECDGECKYECKVEDEEARTDVAVPPTGTTSEGWDERQVRP